MKKTLIALAVLGAAAGVAHAQSNVTIYGVVDTGFIKKSGHDVEMGENVNNRLGFRGVEDLGGGMKATFELERRFNLNDGTIKKENKDWDGAANVGLKGDAWGAVRLGRVNELTTETIRKFDPFYQYGVAGMIEGTQRSARIDNTIRYDSPNWSGFHFGASYSLGQNTHKDSAKWTLDEDGNRIMTDVWEAKDEGSGYDNDGYGIMLGYDNGPLSLVGNWSKIADSADSTVWNLGAAYRFGPAKVELLYQQTKDKAISRGGYTGVDAGALTAMSTDSLVKFFGPDGKYANFENLNSLNQKQWLLGLEWKVGPGRLNASAQWMEVELAGTGISDKDIYKYGIGYTYDLSKRTSIYGNVAYTDYDDEVVARAFGDADDSVTAVQVGITHKF
jgi:predicted porin